MIDAVWAPQAESVLIPRCDLNHKTHERWCLLWQKVIATKAQSFNKARKLLNLLQSNHRLIKLMEVLRKSWGKKTHIVRLWVLNLNLKMPYLYESTFHTWILEDLHELAKMNVWLHEIILNAALICLLRLLGSNGTSGKHNIWNIIIS